jgi:hypothetical protein
MIAAQISGADDERGKYIPSNILTEEITLHTFLSNVSNNTSVILRSNFVKSI